MNLPWIKRSREAEKNIMHKMIMMMKKCFHLEVIQLSPHFTIVLFQMIYVALFICSHTASSQTPQWTRALVHSPYYRNNLNALHSRISSLHRLERYANKYENKQNEMRHVKCWSAFYDDAMEHCVQCTVLIYCDGFKQILLCSRST